MRRRIQFSRCAHAAYMPQLHHSQQSADQAAASPSPCFEQVSARKLLECMKTTGTLALWRCTARRPEAVALWKVTCGCICQDSSVDSALTHVADGCIKGGHISSSTLDTRFRPAFCEPVRCVLHVLCTLEAHRQVEVEGMCAMLLSSQPCLSLQLLTSGLKGSSLLLTQYTAHIPAQGRRSAVTMAVQHSNSRTHANCPILLLIRMYLRHQVHLT